MEGAMGVCVRTIFLELIDCLLAVCLFGMGCWVRYTYHVE